MGNFFAYLEARHANNRLDAWMAVFGTGLVTLVLVKHHGQFTASQQAQLLLLLLFLLAASVWWTRHPATLTPHRTLLLCVIRLSFGVGTGTWRGALLELERPPYGTTIFSVSNACVFLSSLILHSFALLLLLAVTWPIAPDVHLFLQLTVLGVALSYNDEVCNSAMYRHPVAVTGIAHAYKFASSLASLVHVPSSALMDRTPVEQCVCVFRMLQIWLGFLLPTIMVVAADQRAFQEFSDSQSEWGLDSATEQRCGVRERCFTAVYAGMKEAGPQFRWVWAGAVTAMVYALVWEVVVGTVRSVST